MTEIYFKPSENPPPKSGKRIFMVVADQTDEFNAALRYAARRAKAVNGRVAILYVMGEEEQGFFFWGKIEERVKQERRAEAETFLQAVAAKIKGVGPADPLLMLEDGERVDAILGAITANPEIAQLILGGDTSGRNPGPLVKYFSGKGMARLQIPLVVVPGHLPPEKIDAMS